MGIVESIIYISSIMRNRIIKSVFVLMLIFVVLPIKAQEITHVKQVGRSIMVEYTLVEDAYVELYYSINGGQTYQGPLKKVSTTSDVLVKAGKQEIYWNLLQEIESLTSDNVRFKIKTISKSVYTEAAKEQERKTQELVKQKEARKKAEEHRKRHDAYWDKDSWFQDCEQVFIPSLSIYEGAIDGFGFEYSILSGKLPSYAGFEINMAWETVAYENEDGIVYNTEYRKTNWTFNLGHAILPWFVVCGGVGVGFKTDLTTDTDESSTVTLPLQAGCIFRIGSRSKNAMLIKTAIHSADYFINSHYYTIGIGWTIKGAGLYD